MPGLNQPQGGECTEQRMLNLRLAAAESDQSAVAGSGDLVPVQTVPQDVPQAASGAPIDHHLAVRGADRR